MAEHNTPLFKRPPRDGHVYIDLISGREGPCVSVGDESGGYRIAGPKPWGGGHTDYRFEVNIEELETQLKALKAQQKVKKESGNG